MSANNRVICLRTLGKFMNSLLNKPPLLGSEVTATEWATLLSFYSCSIFVEATPKSGSRQKSLDCNLRSLRLESRGDISSDSLHLEIL